MAALEADRPADRLCAVLEANQAGAPRGICAAGTVVADGYTKGSVAHLDLDQHVRRVRVLGLLAILGLVISGVGYLVLDDALAAAAFASLPLLLVWVAATAAVLSRLGEPRSATPAIAASIRN